MEDDSIRYPNNAVMPITLLDRYIVKRLADYFFLGVVVFTLVLFFSDALLDFMKDLQHYGIPMDIALTIIGLQIPRIVAIVIPMSALLATLMVYNNMSNQFELIAMRMSGVSLYRLARPAILIGLAACTASFLLINFVQPVCNKYSRALKTFAINQQNLPATEENFTYKQFDENQQLKRLFYISKFDHNKLGYSTVIDLTNPETLQVIQARSGLWGAKSIELENANVYTVTTNQKLSNHTRASHLELQHFIQPQTSVSEYKPRELSFFALRRWINENRDPVSKNIYINLWEKLTGPLSSLPLFLIAVQLAMTSPRKMSNMGFLAAILILFLYYLIRHLSVQLGETTAVPAILAASLPLILISITAMALFHRKNRVL